MGKRKRARRDGRYRTRVTGIPLEAEDVLVRPSLICELARTGRRVGKGKGWEEGGRKKEGEERWKIPDEGHRDPSRCGVCAGGASAC